MSAGRLLVPAKTAPPAPVEADAAWDRPRLEIEVEALLAEDVVEPNELQVPAPEGVGGYSTGMTVLGILWAAGLVALLTVGRKRGGDDETAAPAAPAAGQSSTGFGAPLPTTFERSGAMVIFGGAVGQRRIANR